MLFTKELRNFSWTVTVSDAVLLGIKETEERYYLLVKEPRKFREASVNCKLRGGALAMPKTSNTNRLMADYVGQAGLTRVFIGVHALSNDTVSAQKHTIWHTLHTHLTQTPCHFILKQDVYLGANFETCNPDTWLTDWSAMGFLGFFFCLFVLLVCLILEGFSQYVYIFVIRMEEATMSMQTPAICWDLHLGAQKRTWILKRLPTQAAWSCSAAECGAAWSVKPPCFSSASSPRAGEEEDEEEEGRLHWHHKSIKRRKYRILLHRKVNLCHTLM